MKNLILIIVSVVVASVFLLAPAPKASALLSGSKDAACSGVNLGSSSTCDSSSNGTISSLIKTILNVVSFLVGFAAVIMIMLGGFKFLTSQGESANVASARNTILYAIVGLVIVALAQFIVKFVLAKTP